MKKYPIIERLMINEPAPVISPVLALEENFVSEPLESMANITARLPKTTDKTIVFINTTAAIPNIREETANPVL